ncbi:GNAT family N-acetyltransferase [Tepidibacter sp. Z1-5]|uniref:GNAT family N-acetyltransferase n=1 Tax=Tepidibacter sp. Z1-5 TaxID=3134138 RepID=UPI0030BBAA40
MSIYLRPADSNDMMILYKWANDETVRKNSFNTSAIDINSHKNWFLNKLKDENTIFYIIMKENKSVGQLRIDINENIGIINYSIDKDYRGQKIGSVALKIIKNDIKNITLIGKVKKENSSSICAFRNANYREFEYEEYIKFIS